MVSVPRQVLVRNLDALGLIIGLLYVVLDMVDDRADPADWGGAGAGGGGGGGPPVLSETIAALLAECYRFLRVFVRCARRVLGLLSLCFQRSGVYRVQLCFEVYSDGVAHRQVRGNASNQRALAQHFELLIGLVRNRLCGAGLIAEIYRDNLSLCRAVATSDLAVFVELLKACACALLARARTHTHTHARIHFVCCLHVWTALYAHCQPAGSI